MATRINSSEIKLFKHTPYVIYQILNKINGNFYIGSSINYKGRWSQHIHLLDNKKHHNRHLQNAWNKYCSKNFMFSILIEVFNKENILKIEEDYIKINKKLYCNKIYNLTDKTTGHSNGLDVSGEKNPKSKLKNSEVLFIRSYFLELNGSIKEKYRFFSKKYSVSELTISRIIRNKSWNNI